MATYLVTVNQTGAEPVFTRLVESKTKAAAVAHVARDLIHAEVADTHTLLDLGAKGVKLETVE